MKSYDLDFQRELLWLSNKPALHTVGRSRALTRLWSSHFALIIGSQRSGTTLMFLMLTAHPKITGLDENHAGFALPPWPVVAVNAMRGMRTVYKLPMATSDLDRVTGWFPRCALIWMVRHPFAVVASMRNLRLQDGQTWIQKLGLAEAQRAMGLFRTPRPGELEGLSTVALAATIWRYKLLAMELYRERDVTVHPVRYEDLVVDPAAVLRGLLAVLRLPWSDNMLRHHEFHGEEYHAGGTRGTDPLDAARRHRGEELTPDEQSVVKEVAGELLPRFGYA